MVMTMVMPGMQAMTQINSIFLSPNAIQIGQGNYPNVDPPRTITVSGSLGGVVVPGCSMVLYYTMEAGQEVTYPPGSCVVDTFNINNGNNLIGFDSLNLCAASLPTVLTQSP